LFFVLLDLLFKLLELLLFDQFGLDELLEPNVMLDFIVKLGTVLTELLLLEFGLLF
jgi:hypothetical protein